LAHVAAASRGCPPSAAARLEAQAVTLRISLKDGEKMIVNGAVLRACGRTEVMVENRAAILRGREVMAPDEADTPARRLYFACMMAYIDPAGAERHHDGIVELLAELVGAFISPDARGACVRLANLLALGHYYKALAECRALIDHEAGLLPRPGVACG
jgi:flagellar protein FlbT